MANIKGITVEIGGDTTGLQTALKSVNTSIKTTSSSLREVTNLLKLDPTNVTLVTQKQKLLTSAIKDTKDKLDTLELAAQQANEQLQNGEITQEQYDALQVEIEKTKQKLSDLEVQAATTNTTLAKISAVGDTMVEVGDKIADVGTKLTTVVTGPIAAVAAAITSVSSTFESSMASVESVISSSSENIEDDMEALEEAARSAGETTQYSASEAADALYYMGLAGWDAKEMVEGLPAVLNLAAAADMDLADASDIVTDYLTAFGLSADDATWFVDEMAYAMSNSNTDVEQLGEAYSACAATAASMGYSVEETTAVLMTMADAGTKGSEAGTALNAIMTRLATDTKGCATELAEYGVEVYDAEGNMNSLTSILEGTAEVWGTLTDEEQAALAKSIAGTSHYSDLAEIMDGLTSEVEDGASKFSEYSDGLSDCSGTAEDMAEILRDTLSGQVTILLSQLQELALEFGEIIMPIILEVVYKLQDLVTWLTNLDDSTKETIVKVAAFAAALGPVLVVVGKVTSGVGKMLTKVNGLATGIAKLAVKISGGTGTITSFGSAFKTVVSTIGPVAVAIGVVVAAVMTLWNTNESFRKNIIAIWNQIQTEIEYFCDRVANILGGLGISFSDITDAISAIWNGFCEVLAPVFVGAFQQISNTLELVFDTICALLTIFTAAFNGDWEAAWQGVQDLFSGVWEFITSTLDTVLDTITGVLDVFLGWIGTSWDEAWNTVCKLVTTVFDAISGVITTVTNTISSFLADAWNTISATIGNVLNTLSSTFSTIWNAISSVVNSATQAIKKYIINPIQDAYDTVSGVLDDVYDAFYSVFENVKKTVSNAIEKIKSYFDFEWSLPDIKLPHFAIKGSFSLDPLSVPSFSVSWYDQGGIFSNPSIIGVGEKRPEFVGALDDLRMIVSEESGSAALVQAVNNMSDIMMAYLPYLPQLADMQVVMDTGETAGALAPAMNKELNKIYRMAAR